VAREEGFARGRGIFYPEAPLRRTEMTFPGGQRLRTSGAEAESGVERARRNDHAG